MFALHPSAILFNPLLSHVFCHPKQCRSCHKLISKELHMTLLQVINYTLKQNKYFEDVFTFSVAFYHHSIVSSYIYDYLLLLIRLLLVISPAAPTAVTALTMFICNKFYFSYNVITPAPS